MGTRSHAQRANLRVPSPPVISALWAAYHVARRCVSCGDAPPRVPRPSASSSALRHEAAAQLDAFVVDAPKCSYRSQLVHGGRGAGRRAKPVRRSSGGSSWPRWPQKRLTRSGAHARLGRSARVKLMVRSRQGTRLRRPVGLNPTPTLAAYGCVQRFIRRSVDLERGTMKKELFESRLHVQGRPRGSKCASDAAAGQCAESALANYECDVRHPTRRRPS